MPEIERIIACSKINLGLEVLRRRHDGYHDLNTLFYRTLEPHDVLEVRASNAFRFTCSDPQLAGDSNLAMRAAIAFEKRSGHLPAIHIHLEKNIPFGAGLGGGSSDAACMLQILQDHAEAPLSEHELFVIGRSLGADVPFFLSGDRAAIASGIGDILTPVELDLDVAIVIVKDREISVSTLQAYANLVLDTDRVPSNLVKVALAPETWGLLRNDFEASVFAHHPKLRSIKQQMLERGAELALMSGSGSAIFGLFTSGNSAANARAAFVEEGLAAYLN